MTWVRLETGFFAHPKALAAGKDGRLLYIAGLCYSAQQLSDGLIPKAALPLIAIQAGTKPTAARALLGVGLWEERGEDYLIHDYLAYQQSRENSEKRSAERSESGKKGARKRWQRDGSSHGSPMADPMANPMANEWLSDGTGQDRTGQDRSPNSFSGASSRAKPAPNSEMGDQSLQDPLTARLTQVLTDGGNPPKNGAAAKVIDHLRRHVDERDIDEHIGYLATLEQPPRDARYLLTCMQRWGRQHDITIPGLGA